MKIASRSCSLIWLRISQVPHANLFCEWTTTGNHPSERRWHMDWLMKAVSWKCFWFDSSSHRNSTSNSTREPTCRIFWSRACWCHISFSPIQYPAGVFCPPQSRTFSWQCLLIRTWSLLLEISQISIAFPLDFFLSWNQHAEQLYASHHYPVT